MNEVVERVFVPSANVAPGRSHEKRRVYLPVRFACLAQYAVESCILVLGMFAEPPLVAVVFMEHELLNERLHHLKTHMVMYNCLVGHPGFEPGTL